MDSINPSITIKELIGEINTLRSHIIHSGDSVLPRLRFEIDKVRRDINGALDNFHVEENDRRYLNKCFSQLEDLQSRMSEPNNLKDHQSGLLGYISKLDRTCCSVQIYLSELELPKLTSR